jgi:hypothetical protein
MNPQGNHFRDILLTDRKLFIYTLDNRGSVRIFHVKKTVWFQHLWRAQTDHVPSRNGDSTLLQIVWQKHIRNDLKKWISCFRNHLKRWISCIWNNQEKWISWDLLSPDRSKWRDLHFQIVSYARDADYSAFLTLCLPDTCKYVSPLSRKTIRQPIEDATAFVNNWSFHSRSTPRGRQNRTFISLQTAAKLISRFPSLNTRVSGPQPTENNEKITVNSCRLHILLLMTMPYTLHSRIHRGRLQNDFYKTLSWVLAARLHTMHLSAVCSRADCVL